MDSAVVKELRLPKVLGSTWLQAVRPVNVGADTVLRSTRALI